MRQLICGLSVMLLVFAAGCGAETKFAPKDFSEEEKQKIAAEDKNVADEESHGTAGKAKTKTTGKK